MNQLLERIESWCHILEEFQSLMNTRQRIVLTAALQIFHMFPNMFSFTAPFDLPNHMTKWRETSSSQADFCSSPLVFLRRSPQGGTRWESMQLIPEFSLCIWKVGSGRSSLGSFDQLMFDLEGILLHQSRSDCDTVRSDDISFFSSPWKTFQTNTFRA